MKVTFRDIMIPLSIFLMLLAYDRWRYPKDWGIEVPDTNKIDSAKYDQQDIIKDTLKFETIDTAYKKCIIRNNKIYINKGVAFKGIAVKHTYKRDHYDSTRKCEFLNYPNDETGSQAISIGFFISDSTEESYTWSQWKVISKAINDTLCKLLNGSLFLETIWYKDTIKCITGKDTFVVHPSEIAYMLHIKSEIKRR